MALPTVETKTILLGGGLDLESPLMTTGEGFALEAENFEPSLMGGYKRMQGYERFDGRKRPSDAECYSVTVSDPLSIIVGETLTGITSGAEAVIIDSVDGVVILTNLVGEFDVDEDFSTNSGAGRLVGPVSKVNPYGDALDWLRLAQDWYRKEIQPVPGEGKVLGVWFWAGSVIAFRSNGSNVVMCKSTSDGWEVIPFFSFLKFNAGTLADGAVTTGTVITGATSGAEATVKRFIKVSGEYGSNAVGYMVVDVTSGSFSGGEQIKVGTTNVFKADGVDSEITLAVGDNKYEFVNHNFKGSVSSYYMYGCDGVNDAFQWDGEVYIPILTGMDDSPTSIDAHSNHLFLAFRGGSLQNSSTGEPLVFNAISGANEMLVGQEIVKIRSVTGKAMFISTSIGIYALYGDDVDNWSMETISVDGGDIGGTLNVMGEPLILTRRGIQRISASNVYGNFETPTLSRRVSPIIQQKLRLSTVVGGSIVRNKNQYRIYFDDGTGLTLTQDNLAGDYGLPQFTTFSLGFKPSSLASVAIDGSDEIILAGGDDGYVYELERGISADGENMVYSLRLPFHHLGSPQLRKSFKWLDVESDVPESAELRVSYEFSDGETHTQRSPLQYYDFSGDRIGYWGADVWGEFNWSGTVVSRESLSMTGTGHNVSVLFYGSSATTSPFSVNAITYQYLSRRPRRAK